MFRAPLWQRPRFVPGPGRATFALFVFFRRRFRLRPRPAADPTDLADWCPYDKWPPGVTCELMPRSANPGFFDGYAAATAKAHAEGVDPGLTPSLVEAIQRATHCARVHCDVEDPPDLGHLQFCWAIVRTLLDQGHGVHDMSGERFFTREAVAGWHRDGWPGGRRFSLEREVRFNLDPGPDGVPLLHTSGMAKFARPELVMAAPPGVPWIPEAHREIATGMALGDRLEPGREVTWGAATLQVEPDTHHLGKAGPSFRLRLKSPPL